MDQILRHSLIKGLQSRGWTHLDAERAADGVAGSYEDREGVWTVQQSQVAGDPEFYRVARRHDEVSIYDSLLEGRARDVASALNELEQSRLG